MDLLEWLLSERPGRVGKHNDRLEIEHADGSHSTLWLSTEREFPEALRTLGDLFVRYDGADLFSSTFKIASVKNPKFRDGVKLTQTLDEIAIELFSYNPPLPTTAVPFMIQQGIGIYALVPGNEKIHEWDTGFHELSEEFSDLTSIFVQWKRAVDS